MSQFLISNIQNYKETLNSTYEDYVIAFKNTIYKYLLHYNLITQEKAITFDLNTLITGIDTIECIFLMLLLKTKNLKLVVQNSENTIFYYFEFVEQINRPRTELHALLNLTIIDAKLFVYKKTIFDMQQKPTILNKKENEILCKLKQFTLVYKEHLALLLKILTIEELIDKFEEYDKYIYTDVTNDDIDKYLSLNASLITKDNLLETLNGL